MKQDNKSSYVIMFSTRKVQGKEITMHIIVVGLNYRTAPVEIRERFALAEEQLPAALEKLKNTASVMECVIVATCNRTEIYTIVDRAQICGHYVRMFIEEWFGMPREQFTNYLYMYEDQKAIEHLFRVTSGLDSMIIGETQILGQVRTSFLEAQKCSATGTVFNMLFKQAVTLAKRAHSETKIGELAVSVSYAAVELGKHIFGQFQQKKVMVIGAGETGELTAQHLHANGASSIYVANRSVEKAEEIADKFAGKAVQIEQMIQHMKEIDIVISSTAANSYVLTYEDVQALMKGRRSKPLFIIDIAVPRDIDPAIASIDNVFLYDIDDLQGIVESNLAQRKQESLKIESMISEEIAVFEKWYKTLGVVPLIRALQIKTSQIHEDTMESMLNKLPDLTEQEQKVIRKLTKSMVNQMVQAPILRVKDLAGQKKSDEAMTMFVKLFALDEQLEQLKQAEAMKQEAEADEYSQLLRPAKAFAAFMRS